MEGSRVADIWRPWESVYGHFTSQVWNAKNQYRWRPVPSERREMRTLHQFLSTVSDDVGTTSTERFCAESKSGMQLDCFLILVSYRCDIFEDKHIGRNWHGLFVRTPSFRCLSTMHNIWLQGVWEQGLWPILLVLEQNRGSEKLPSSLRQQYCQRTARGNTDTIRRGSNRNVFIKATFFTEGI